MADADPEPVDPLLLGIPLGFVAAVVGLELVALGLAVPVDGHLPDFVALAVTGASAGLPAASLGYGSCRVVPVRWPLVVRWLGGAGAVVLLAALARAIIGGATQRPEMTSSSGGASLLFAVWALEFAVPTAVVAFLLGRAVGQGLPITQPSATAARSPIANKT